MIKKILCVSAEVLKEFMEQWFATGYRTAIVHRLIVCQL